MLNILREEIKAGRNAAQDNQVAVLGQYTWLVKSTGRTFSGKWVHVITLSNGKITRFREYTDTAAAVEGFSK